MIDNQVFRWENNQKYYEAYIGKDLFGQLVVICYYGSKHRKSSSRCVTYPVSSLDEAYQLLQKISTYHILPT